MEALKALQKLAQQQKDTKTLLASYGETMYAMRKMKKGGDVVTGAMTVLGEKIIASPDNKLTYKDMLQFMNIAVPEGETKFTRSNLVPFKQAFFDCKFDETESPESVWQQVEDWIKNGCDKFEREKEVLKPMFVAEKGSPEYNRLDLARATMSDAIEKRKEKLAQNHKARKEAIASHVTVVEDALLLLSARPQTASQIAPILTNSFTYLTPRLVKNRILDTEPPSAQKIGQIRESFGIS